MTIGERIKEKREALGMSQRDLADKMNYSNHSTIGKIERGLVDVSQSRIVQFAEVLHTDIAYLMGWEEVQKNNDAMSDIIIRMRNDSEFFCVVKTLHKLDKEKLNRVGALLNAFVE